jgi:hypothetical protein
LNKGSDIQKKKLGDPPRHNKRKESVMQSDCDHEYGPDAERDDVSGDYFVTCGKCRARLFKKPPLAAQVEPVPMMKLKGRRRRMGKPFIVIKALKEWWRDGKKFAQRIYVTNHESNKYTEKVVDLDTDSVIHQCDEPLSEHHKKRP